MSISEADKPIEMSKRLTLSSLVIFNNESFFLENFEISAFQCGKRLPALDTPNHTCYSTTNEKNDFYRNPDFSNFKFRNIDFWGDSPHLYSILINSQFTYDDPYKPIFLIISTIKGDSKAPAAFGRYLPISPNNIFLEYTNETINSVESIMDTVESNWNCKSPVCCCKGNVLCLNHVNELKRQFGILVKKNESKNVYNRHHLNIIASKLARYIQFANDRKICQGYHNIFGVITEKMGDCEDDDFFVDKMSFFSKNSFFQCHVADNSFRQWNVNSIIRMYTSDDQVLKYLISLPLYGIKNFDDSSTAIFDITRRFVQKNPFLKSLIFKNVKYLSSYHQALPVFLRAVDWSTESDFALYWLRLWNPPGMTQILDLLGMDFYSLPQKGSLDPTAVIRQYAVRALDKMDSLHLFISPLVLSLKLESYKGPLSTYLLKKCSKDFKLGCKFYWSLLCCKDLDDKRLELFMHSCSEPLYEAIKLQHALRDNLLQIVDDIKDIWLAKDKNKRLHKMNSFERLSKMLISCSNECPFPLNPDISIQRIIPTDCYVMKSHQYPIYITCKTETGNKSFIFKHGDDLRQDQLFTEMVSLFEIISNDTVLDFSLNHYQVLPFSNSDGIVEFISDTKPISSVLKLPGGIEEFLKLTDISPADVLNNPIFINFINSLAAYSMITYLFQVGDRHLDNLLLHINGSVMHIDFGYMFGADPKPFVNAHFRICSEIVAFIGGVNSPGFEMFRTACRCMFSILRRHANLIFSMLYNYSFAELRNFTSSGIHDCRKKMDTMAKRLMIGEKIDVKSYVDNMIDESVNSITPVIMDKVHKLALYWK